MKRCWWSEFSKCIFTMESVTIPPLRIRQVEEFTEAVIQRKQGEQHHEIDYGHERKRFRTGLMGEVAIEQLYGCRFIDWSIGDSSEYNHADLINIGADVGVKTAEIGNFPIIHKYAHRPEFICIQKAENVVIVCGLATIPTLNKYQDDELIKSFFLYSRGTKTGFYGFSHLQKIETLDDLIKQYPRKEHTYD